MGSAASPPNTISITSGVQCQTSTNTRLGITNVGEYTHSDGGEHNQLDTWQFGDHLALIKGKHTLKMGAEWYLVRIERAAANIPNGAASFSALQTGYDFASLLLGYPNTTTTAEALPML